MRRVRLAVTVQPYIAATQPVTLLAGVVHQVARPDIATAVAVQSSAMALGFTVLACSLYADGPGSVDEDGEPTGASATPRTASRG